MRRQEAEKGVRRMRTEKQPYNQQPSLTSQGGLECPSWLLPEAKKEWQRLAPSLQAMGMLTAADLTAFEGYCQAYARWMEAEAFITKHGSIFKTPSGYVQQVPQVSIARQNLKIMQSFCSDFGLTPATRAKMIARGKRLRAKDRMPPEEASICPKHDSK